MKIISNNYFKATEKKDFFISIYLFNYFRIYISNLFK